MRDHQYIEGTSQQRYDELEFTTALEQDPQTTRWHCPTPNCNNSALIDRDDTTIHPILCEECSTISCTACHEAWESQGVEHDGRSCEAFAEAKGDRSMQLYVNEQRDNAKQCPRCRNMIEKNRGCLHMKCVRGEGIEEGLGIECGKAYS